MSTIKRPSVSANPALHYLYVIGAAATVVGILVALICAGVFQAFGLGLTSTGLLAIVGATVAQAINWQIVNPRDDSQDKTYREFRAEHE